MMARILAHQRDLGNGVGLHYSGFHRFSAVPAPSNQLLASIPPRKNRYYCQPIREDGLTGVYRGLYGTYAVDLPAGSQFLALAAGTFFYDVLPSQFVGQTLYFEFPSFNPTGGGAQPISETAIYSYVPVGSSVIPGLFPQLVIRDAGVPSEVGSGSVR